MPESTHPHGLPAYICHQRAWAAKIKTIEKVADIPYWRLSLDVPEKTVEMTVGQDWMTKNCPVVGGYYVEQEDGTTSHSPAKVFTKGYRKVKGLSK